MKLISKLLAVAVIMTIVSCNHQNKTNEDNKVSNLENKFDNKGNVVHINNATFKEIIMDYSTNPQTWAFKGQKPCIVDFYADWCGPCKRVAPIMEELAKEYSGKINIYKINIDEEKDLSNFFRIESIPALLFSPMQGQPFMQAGAMSKEDYKKMIDDMLANTKSKDSTKVN